jgi:uncharacterized membrane protein YfcA
MQISGLEVLLLLFALALVAGIIDSMAGGGGLLIVPGLMAAGLDPVAAFATNKLQGIFGTASAAVQFWRKGRVRFRDHAFPAAMAFLSAVCGAVSLSYLDPGILKSIVPFLLIFVAFAVLLKPNLGDVPRKARLSFVAGALTVIPLIGFYDGFFGPGTGAFFALGAVAFLGLGLEEATIRAKIFNLMSNLGGLAFFIWGGHASWTHGAVMAAGNIIGGNLGARLILRHGTGVIKPVLVTMSLAISIKLLWQQGTFEGASRIIEAALRSPPVISQVGVSRAGVVGIGETIPITLAFTKPVFVSGGTPVLLLNNGGMAVYTSGSGASTLIFDYTVSASERSVAALAVTGASLRSASIHDQAGREAAFKGAASRFAGLRVETQIPAVTSLHASPERGVEQAGSAIAFALRLSEAVLVTGGTPILLLNDGGAATYSGGAGTNLLTFTHKVGANATSVPVLAVTGFKANGATIANVAGNTADLSAAAGTFSDLQIDTATPVVTQVATSPGAGYVRPGKKITVTLNFSKPVKVRGTPLLTLNNGGFARYKGGSGTAALAFSYRVAAGQNASDLRLVGVNLPGSASIVDMAGHTANLAGSKTGLGLQIDTLVPAVSTVAASPGSGALNTGKTVAITLKMNKPVLVTGAPTLSLNNGGTAILHPGHSTSSSLTFNYRVAPEQDTSSLKVMRVNLPAAASIQDLADNNADLSGAVASLGLQIDTKAPAVMQATAASNSKTLRAGQPLTITLGMSKPVAVTGSPTLLLDDGGIATYDASFSTGTALTFNHTVAAGQNTPALKITGVNLAAGSSIHDLAGNHAVLSGANGNLGLRIDTLAPTIAKVTASPPHGMVSAGQNVAITLKTNEAVKVAGRPILLLNDGGAAIYDASHSTAASLVFNYSVQSNRGTPALSVVGIELPSPGAIQDRAGNIARLAGAAAVLGLKVNSNTAGPADVTISGTSQAEIFGASSQNVIFAAGASGTLKLDSALNYAGNISGLSIGDTIDLTDLAYGPNMTVAYSVTNTGGTLSVSNGTETAHIALLGNYLQSEFAASSDGQGGTCVVATPRLAFTPLAPASEGQVRAGQSRM